MARSSAAQHRANVPDQTIVISSNMRFRKAMSRSLSHRHQVHARLVRKPSLIFLRRPFAEVDVFGLPFVPSAKLACHLVRWGLKLSFNTPDRNLESAAIGVLLDEF